MFGLLKGNKAVKIIDRAISGVDALFFTKEEKAEYLKKVGDANLEFVRTTISENSGRSKSRRIIATLIIGLYVLVALVYMVSIFWAKEESRQVLELFEVLSPLALLVAAFFFGTYGIGNHLLNRKKK